MLNYTVQYNQVKLIILCVFLESALNYLNPFFSALEHIDVDGSIPRVINPSSRATSKKSISAPNIQQTLWIFAIYLPILIHHADDLFFHHLLDTDIDDFWPVGINVVVKGGIRLWRSPAHSTTFTQRDAISFIVEDFWHQLDVEMYVRLTTVFAQRFFHNGVLFQNIKCAEKRLFYTSPSAYSSAHPASP